MPVDPIRRIDRTGILVKQDEAKDAIGWRDVTAAFMLVAVTWTRSGAGDVIFGRIEPSGRPGRQVTLLGLRITWIRYGVPRAIGRFRKDDFARPCCCSRALRPSESGETLVSRGRRPYIGEAITKRRKLLLTMFINLSAPHSLAFR